MKSSIDLIKEVLTLEANSILKLIEQLPKNIDDIIKTLRTNSSRLVVTGMGKSGIIGKKISATLASTGTPSFFLHPAEAFHGDLGMVQKQDTILMISYSGETEELIRLVPFFKTHENKIILMCGNSKSTLGKNCDFFLSTHVEKEACPLQLAPTCSTTATLALGDALAITIMTMRDFKAEDFARFHPGGSLGKKLLSKVKDVMRTENLPVVASKASFLQVVDVISKGRLGLTIVMDHDKISGVITDGDLRRTMEKFQEKSFSMQAIDFTTPHPLTISLDLSLSEAENILLTKKISTLLVTKDSKLLGVLQVYDIK
ncbi:MAG: KpsF/GutQ family sugar-phosphate isomerase [Bacteriovoracaceae bacterium]|nr:KpsF/GutQ family sugar-phosphate isomerase [Bacteriovoracaceae bacterium]